MKCQIVGCDEEAEYLEEFTTDTVRLVKVAVCEKHYLERFCHAHLKGSNLKIKILRHAERIDGKTYKGNER